MTSMQKINELDQVYQDGLSQYGTDDLWPGPFMKYTADQSTELSFYNLDIRSIFSNKMATWVSLGGVEDEWDDYLSALESAGLQDAIEIYQDVYDLFAK